MWVMELDDCTNVLLREIAMKEFHQRNIAGTYRLALLSSQETDWEKVNTAIIERWSMAGLERVKKLAWGKGVA